MRRFVFCLPLLLAPQTAHAQFDFLGAAQKILTQTKPIMVDGQNTAPAPAASTTPAPIDTAPILTTLDQFKTALATPNATQSVGGLSNADLEKGLRQTLEVSATKVTNQLGNLNGFYNDPKIKIPLPAQLQTAHKMLSQVGLESLGNDLELKINHAAELAMPQAKELFLSSIKQMTLTDAKTILSGGDNAATAFFQNKMSGDLMAAMRPIIDAKLMEVKGVQTYNQLASQYANIPFAPKIDTDLSSYVTNMAIDGVFSYMGREEAAIRANPVERSTALLQKVFAATQTQ